MQTHTRAHLNTLYRTLSLLLFPKRSFEKCMKTEAIFYPLFSFESRTVRLSNIWDCIA